MDDFNGTAAILKELECRECTDYMHPPIRLCVIGHSFCHKCYEKVDNCPTCRNPKGTARNYVLEILHNKLLFPCKNKIGGCNEIIFVSKIKEHEEMCVYSPFDCPLKVRNNCKWRGHLIDVIEHFESNHPKQVSIASEIKPKFSNILTCKIIDYFDCFLFYIFKEIFKLTLQINFKTGIMKWCVFHLGSNNNESAARYSYEIKIKNRELTKQCISLKSSCQPNKSNKDTISNEHYLITHCDMFKPYCIDEKFYFAVKIYNHPVVEE